MKLSIITPLYNRLDLTKAFVAALPASLPRGLDWECILVDDGSTDGTAAWLRGLAPPFRAAATGANHGFAVACNCGAREAGGDVLALLNNDLVLPPGWLDPLLRGLRRRRAALVGNVQRRVSDGALDHAGIGVSAAAKIAHVRRWPWPARGTRPAFAVTAACCLVRRAEFLELGGFDEGFANGGEDVDLALRLRARGRRTLVCLDSVVGHHVSASRGPQSLRDEQNSRRLYQRWRGAIVDEAARAWARAAVRPARARQGWEALRAALTCLPVAAGVVRRPPRIARLHASQAVHREELRWQALAGERAGPAASVRPSQYRIRGVFWDETNSDTAWLRDSAGVELPPQFPVRNFFLNGFVLPPDPTHPESAGPIGLRLCINGTQIAAAFPLPENHFNFGLDAPAALPDRPTRVEIDLLGVGRTNFLAWLGRIIADWPLPRRWREAAGAYRRQRLNLRLRLSQVVADDEVIFDFRFQPPLAPRLRKLGAPAGVNLVGWFRGELGIGESVRCMARACAAAGVPAALVDLKLPCLNAPGDTTFAGQLQTANPYPVNIFHIDPPVGQDIDHHHGAAFRADHYNIAYWAWELPEFPDAWVGQHRFYDEIWCPSEFTRAAVAAKLPKPVLAMPHAIDLAVPAGDGRARFGLPDGVFLFLFIYDFNSTQERKNPAAVIEAFRRAFPAGGPVGLVIKCQNAERQPGDFAALEAALAGLPGAYLVNCTLSRADVSALEQACDCFVSLHRAEGFGLGAAEAMFLGRPVIATDWSGTAEFINFANGCPVNYRLVRLERDHGPYSRGQTWADPDVDHAAHWMRQLATDPDLCRRLGQQAAADIRRLFSPEAVGRRYVRRFAAFSLW